MAGHRHLVRAAAIYAVASLSCVSIAEAATPPPTEAEILQHVAFEQKMGSQVPLDAVFRDETGRSVTLEQATRGQPAVLVLGYYRCPMLCRMVLNELVGTVKQAEHRPGRDFQVVVISIDPEEMPELARQKKRAFLPEAGRQESAGWCFLTGEEPAIRAVTDAVGFRYRYDPSSDEYAHPAGVAVLGPDGTVSRYLLGVDFPVRDLNLALVEAGNGQVGSLTDQLLLRCYRYDPTAGRYGFAIMSVLRISSVVMVVALIGLIWKLSGHRRRPEHGHCGRDGSAGTSAERSIG